MSTLYIRLPSKAAAEAVEHWLALPCPYAMASGEAIEREGVAPPAELAAAITAAKRVVLLLAAGDVTLLRVKTPPLSAAKLKLALPNLVEDQLMTDSGECVFAAGEMVDGLRTVAVAQRGWLDILVKTFSGFGASNLAALPAQLCLPHQSGRLTAAVAEYDAADIDIALRLDEYQGLGLTIMAEAARDVLDTLDAISASSLPLTLYVMPERVAAYQEALRDNGLDDIAARREISVFADNWPSRIAAAGKLAPNLLAGMSVSGGSRAQWREWRWPMVLAASLLLVNAAGLNLDWWRLKREATNLRTGMIQIYKSTYPKETVILDALAQMQKKVAAAERDAGQAGAGDFAIMTANFGEVLSEQLREQNLAAPAIAALEYRENGLLVHLKPDSRLSADKMKAALAARRLSMSSPSNGVWQIRSVP